MTEDVTVKRLRAAKRLLAAQQARDDFYTFMRLMLPDPVDPDDSTLSEYEDTRHGRLLCDLVEKIESGELKRVGVSIPPQHGKTIHLSQFGPAWILGKNPKAKIIVATYNETRGEELGAEFRKVVSSAPFRQIFPDCALETGSKSKSAMRTTRGGTVFFVGAGGTITGRGADYFIIDDPIKDDKEVQSAQFREELWKWFFSVAMSRGSNRTRMAVIHTRWNGDDLLGRLCDEDHPERKKRFDSIAKNWLYLNISAVIEDQKLANALGIELKVQTDPLILQAFGRKPIAALWPERKDLSFLAQWKIGEPETFSALAMGKPGTDDGDYFKAEWLVEYNEDELPENLEIYAASDHATSVKKGRDYTVLGCVGVDEKNNVWFLPDLFWDRVQTDRAVEEMIVLMQRHNPIYWWMESENISKSFGPFLLKRMDELNVYVPIDEVTVSADKRTRARAAQGRMAMKKFRFPRFAPWWHDAKQQLLRFDKGANDDFVDFVAHIGLGLLKQHTPSAEQPKEDTNVVSLSGSPQWLLRQTLLRVNREKREAGSKGW